MTFTEKAATIGRTGYQLLKLSVATVQDMGRVAVKGTGWEQSYSGATHSIQAYVRAAQIHLGNLTWNLDLEEGVNSYCNLKGFEKVSLRDWLDYKWQLKNTFQSPAALLDALGIKYDRDQWEEIRQKFAATEGWQMAAEDPDAVSTFPMRVTPSYAASINTFQIDPAVLAKLADPKNWKDLQLWRALKNPILMQSFMHPAELIRDEFEESDSLHEDDMKGAPSLTHRYPDRALLEITGQCGMYCRHCTRKRKVDKPIPWEQIRQGIDYIAAHKEIRDVIVSGGDAFLASDEILDRVLSALEKIPHLETIRMGTRTPVVLPQRITPELVAMLKRHQGNGECYRKSLWINTHFNHPNELLNPESRRSLRMLAEAGIPIGNQSVLLAGVNDDPKVMMSLVHMLVQNHVRPYYIYINDLAVGISHFRTPVSKGLEIMAALRGNTSGFAVPVFVIDAPGGGGKIPLAPQYAVGIAPHGAITKRDLFRLFPSQGNSSETTRQINKLWEILVDEESNGFIGGNGVILDKFVALARSRFVDLLFRNAQTFALPLSLAAIEELYEIIRKAQKRRILMLRNYANLVRPDSEIGTTYLYPLKSEEDEAATRRLLKLPQAH